MSTEITPRQLELIEAAGRLMTTGGVRGLTIKKLASELGFSEPAVYRHFASKEAIVVAMLHYLKEQLNVLFSQVSQDLPAPERLRAQFGCMLRFFDQHPHFVVVVFSDGLLAERAAIDNHLFNIMQMKRTHLLAILEAGQQAGDFTTALSSEQLAHIMMGAFRLQMFKWRVADFKPSIEPIGHKLIDALIQLTHP